MNQIYELNGYTLHLIPIKHLKTTSISIKMQAPLDRKTVTLRTLLSFMLVSSTKQYPSYLLLNRYLESLYGAILSCSVSTKGQAHIINCNATIINNQYTEVDLLKQTLNLLNDIFNNPNVKDGQYDEEICRLKKAELSQRYQSIQDDKVTYSLNQMFSFMGEQSAISIDTMGYKEDLDRITPSELYEAHLDMMKNDHKHVYIMGDFDESVVDVFKNNLYLGNHNSVYPTSYTFKSTKKEVLEMIERQDLTQSKLNIGYTVDGNFKTRNHMALTLFNMILGGYSQSKLFLNVREKHSLCYYVSSGYDAFNGFMYIMAGIDANQYEKTCRLIDETIQSIQNGEITDEELEIAKIMISNNVLKSHDEPNRYIGLLYNRDITEKKETLEEMIASIQQVTKEEIVEASRTLKKDTIYFLTGKDANGSY